MGLPVMLLLAKYDFRSLAVKENNENKKRNVPKKREWTTGKKKDSNCVMMGIKYLKIIIIIYISSENH